VKRTLGRLQPGDRGQVVAVGHSPEMDRLMELGFLEGESIEVLHQAPLGADPIAVRVRGSTIALRRAEADAVEVEVQS